MMHQGNVRRQRTSFNSWLRSSSSFDRNGALWLLPSPPMHQGSQERQGRCYSHVIRILYVQIAMLIRLVIVLLGIQPTLTENFHERSTLLLGTTLQLRRSISSTAKWHANLLPGYEARHMFLPSCETSRYKVARRLLQSSVLFSQGGPHITLLSPGSSSFSIHSNFLSIMMQWLNQTRRF